MRISSKEMKVTSVQIEQLTTGLRITSAMPSRIKEAGQIRIKVKSALSELDSQQKDLSSVIQQIRSLTSSDFVGNMQKNVGASLDQLEQNASGLLTRESSLVPESVRSLL